MATRSKAFAPATRASTRTKTPPVSPPSPPPAIKATKTKGSTRSTTAAGTLGTKKTAARKPLTTRANSPDVKPTVPKKAVGKPRVGTRAAPAEQEPIMAYLRIRPHLSDDEATSMPYLDPLTDIAVRMTYPSGDSRGVLGLHYHYRASMTPPSSIYKFSHVFLPSTQQADFFAKTTLPLVRDLLDGQNGLLFAYGVTNSGKTYTIQGDNTPGSAGILPRTLDVIFNSVEGLHSDGRYRPVRLYGVEDADPSDPIPPPIDVGASSEPALAEVLTEHMETSNDSEVDTDSTAIKLDRNYEYSIWVSYVEVYNEKVYDLLASVNDEQDKEETVIPRSTSNPTGHSAHPVLVTRKALAVKPSPASDAVDDTGAGSAGKYISGLKQFRVTNAVQAKALVKLGQLHRRVFGTLANSQSSRSHSMITIKILRNHRSDRDDPSSVQISRLTLVDLAGSERTKHTQTTGDRLKEAGNINKSLMVLGQCMEVMRSNQRRLAQSLAIPGRSDTRDVKKALAVVPFRHSKLTEILMDYFAGDGRIVMIVNINPYDTGFDENSHVMKFSALAREVSTVVNNAPLPRVQASPTKHSAVTKPAPAEPPRGVTRKVTISSFGPGKKHSEAHLEVLEEDEEVDDDDQNEDSDDEPINPLVDALFDEIEELRLRLYEAEMRCAIVEAETREEVMREMEERMRAVERTCAQRLMNEVERNERKMDAKIDMLHQAGLLGTAKNPAVVSTSESETEDSKGGISQDDLGHFANESGMDADLPSSPLQGKGKSAANAGHITRHAARSETDGSVPSVADDDTDGTIPEVDEDEDGDMADLSISDNESDDYVPPPSAIEKKGKSQKALLRIAPTKPAKPSTDRRSTKSAVSKLEQDINGLSISGDVGPEVDDSVIILPNRRVRQATAELGGVEYVPGKGEVDTMKKKKRQLGKKTVVTEEQLEEVVGAMEQRTLRKKNIRRMGRMS
ncbi:kinesin-domain-containing protein [Gyrodon lividus]|nr:kinesin-domain-containing protein [Gyrodon lividus]